MLALQCRRDGQMLSAPRGGACMAFLRLYRRDSEAAVIFVKQLVRRWIASEGTPPCTVLQWRLLQRHV